MKRLILAVFAILMFATTPWAQTAAPQSPTFARVDSRATKHRAHAHHRRTSRHRSHRRHST